MLHLADNSDYLSNDSYITAIKGENTWFERGVLRLKSNASILEEYPLNSGITFLTYKSNTNFPRFNIRLMTYNYKVPIEYAYPRHTTPFHSEGKYIADFTKEFPKG
ncbi:hypothetical protein ES703_01495 [subsurface metagenome]